MNFDLPDDLVALRDSVRKFAAERIRPFARDWDRDQWIPDSTVRELGEMGLLGLTTPVEFGGSGRGYLANSVVMEEVARQFVRNFRRGLKTGQNKETQGNAAAAKKKTARKSGSAKR